MKRAGCSATSVVKRSCADNLTRFSSTAMGDTNRGVSDAHVQPLSTPIKPTTDKRLYRAIRLANGMRALLISDTFNRGKQGTTASDDDQADEKMAATSMAVGCGSFCDPPSLPGLAHFVEHMVSMGTGKYPEENGFDVFVKNSGGSWNAHTECEQTVFYFDVNTTHMQQALDRFAQLFVCPLMRVESMQRERQAVENEFQDALPHDSSRQEQLLSSVARADHPMSRFMWGNLHSLSSAGSGMDDVQINAELHQFWRRHYRATNMCLVVQAQHSLDTLQQWVASSFADVSGLQDDQKHSFADNGLPWDMTHFNRLYKVVAVKDRHYLKMMWQLPSLVEHYRSRPLGYLSWLIGHEGSGSILAYLKRQKWAVLLESGNAESGFEHNSTCSCFHVTVKLTDQGLEHVSDVVRSVWAYMSMLRRLGPQDRIFTEISRVSNMSFQYMEECSPQYWVESLSSNMLVYAPEDYIRGDFLTLKYDPGLITKCLDAMLPSTCNVMLSSKTFAEQNICDKTELWFGTKFTSTNVPSLWLDEGMGKIENNFHLPLENPFIAEKLDLFTPPDAIPSYPLRIDDAPVGELFYRFDVKFQLPRAFILLLLRSNLPQQSAHNAALLDLFNNMMSFSLTEHIYPASVARLYYCLLPTQSGYEVRVDGFNDKLPHVLYLILDHIINFEQKVMSTELFNVMKHDVNKAYLNSMLDASKLGRDLRLKTVLHQHWLYSEKNQALMDATESSLVDFVRRFRSELFIQMLVQGNIEQDQAVSIFNTVRERLGCRALARQDINDVRVVELPQSDNYARIASLNKDSTKSCVTNFYQGIPARIASNCVTELLVNLMEEPTFDFLRTQEQLGYHVTSKMVCAFGVIGLAVVVHFHADKYTSEHVDAKIEDFLGNFEGHLLKLPQDEFDMMCESLESNKQCADVSLEEEVYRNWREIVSGQYVFDRLTREVEVLASATRQQVVDHFRVLTLAAQSVQRRKLSVQVVGYPSPSSSAPGTLIPVMASCSDSSESSTDVPSLQFLAGDKPDPTAWISSVSHFKSGLSLYPVCKVVE